MKNFTFTGLAAIVLCQMMFSACTIEKRHYRPGYHIEWKGGFSGISSEQEVLTDSENKPMDLQQEKSIDQPERTTSPTNYKQVDAPGTATKESTTTATPFPTHHYTTPNTIPEKDAAVMKFNETVKKNSTIIFPEPAVISEALKYFIAGMLMFGGLFPFAILLMVGAGPEFNRDLIVWIAGVALAIVSLIISSFALSVIGVILLLASAIYAVIVLLQNR